jgi:glycosyltransferase involved in cell wall biosynthesis
MPEDVAQITLGLEGLLTDTAWREAARCRGLERARAFTWEACVDRTVEVYKKVE